MMGWISRRLGDWACRVQARELKSFVDNLRAMDGQELGLVVATATHIRHQCEKLGYPVFNLWTDEIKNCDLAIALNRIIKEKQKKGQLTDAAALMIWLHSVRARQRLELRQLGRDMWRELERGFPWAENHPVFLLTNVDCNLNGFNDFPPGLTPYPLP
jgi:hypothetical protein